MIILHSHGFGDMQDMNITKGAINWRKRLSWQPRCCVKRYDAYEKACLDLVECFKVSTEILIIDPDRFRMLMLLLKSPTRLDWNIAVQPFTIIEAKELIPDIVYQIDPNGVPQFFNSPAATSLVKEYG